MPRSTINTFLVSLLFILNLKKLEIKMYCIIFKKYLNVRNKNHSLAITKKTRTDTSLLHLWIQASVT
jgi:hypothetical protein